MPMDLVRLFDKWYGPDPADQGDPEQTGAWDSVGETRIIELAGGGSARETPTTVNAPEFGYSAERHRGSDGPSMDHVDGTAFRTLGYRHRGDVAVACTPNPRSAPPHYRYSVGYGAVTLRAPLENLSNHLLQLT